MGKTMLKMTKIAWTPPLFHSVNGRIIGDPIQNRYFILKGMTAERFGELVRERRMTPRDTIYLSPKKKGPIGAFKEAASELKIYDLRLYDEKGLLADLKRMGHTVIEIKK